MHELPRGERRPDRRGVAESPGTIQGLSAPTRSRPTQAATRSHVVMSALTKGIERCRRREISGLLRNADLQMRQRGTGSSVRRLLKMDEKEPVRGAPERRAVPFSVAWDGGSPVAPLAATASLPCRPSRTRAAADRGRAAGSGRSRITTGRKHHWAFGVDATKCIGCLRCVEACKAENEVAPDAHHFRTWVERYVYLEGEDTAAHRQPGRSGEHRGLRLRSSIIASPTAIRTRRSTRRSSFPSCATTAPIRPACRCAPPARPTRPTTAWC